MAAGGLGVALAVAVFLAPFASEYDDGLEWVGGKLGFLKEGTPVLAAPIPDYQLTVPGLSYVPAPRPSRVRWGLWSSSGRASDWPGFSRGKRPS